MLKLQNLHSCASGPFLIFSCSGAADVGELADQAARKLSREGWGMMSCTAGIGGAMPGLIESAKSAKNLLALDGCPVSCVKCLLEKGEIAGFRHVRITDLGFIKGQTEINASTTDKVCEMIKDPAERQQA